MRTMKWNKNIVDWKECVSNNCETMKTVLNVTYLYKSFYETNSSTNHVTE